MNWLAWYNVTGYTCLGVLIVYALTVMAGVIGGDGVDSGHADSDADADYSSTTGDHESHWGLWGFRGMLGVGKAPLATVMSSLLGVFGMSILIANHFLRVQLENNDLWALASFGIGAVVAIATTRYVAAGFGKLMPMFESYSSPASELVGKTGIVKLEVSQTMGTVTVQDSHGSSFDVEARVTPGQAAIASGSVVRLESLVGTVFLAKLNA